jgi:hypothetical protein
VALKCSNNFSFKNIRQEQIKMHCKLYFELQNTQNTNQRSKNKNDMYNKDMLTNGQKLFSTEL